MSESALQSQVDAANAYESLFVQALFGEWAPRVAGAARLASGERVLDVACGTGVLARHAASVVGPSGSVVGLDPNPGMLEVARRLEPAVDWRQGVAESLPFADGSFDAVVSQFGLMFFTDREQAIREMARVLAPGGRLAVAVWDSLERSPGYAVEVALLERIAGREAADAVRAPYVLDDREELAALFARAGAPSVEIETHGGTARFPSVRVMSEADLRGWLPVMGIDLDEERIARVLAEAEHDLRPFVAPDGSVEFESSAHVVAWTKPT